MEKLSEKFQPDRKAEIHFLPDLRAVVNSLRLRLGAAARAEADAEAQGALASRVIHDWKDDVQKMTHSTARTEPNAGCGAEQPSLLLRELRSFRLRAALTLQLTPSEEHDASFAASSTSHAVDGEVTSRSSLSPACSSETSAAEVEAEVPAAEETKIGVESVKELVAVLNPIGGAQDGDEANTMAATGQYPESPSFECSQGDRALECAETSELERDSKTDSPQVGVNPVVASPELAMVKLREGAVEQDSSDVLGEFKHERADVECRITGEEAEHVVVKLNLEIEDTEEAVLKVAIAAVDTPVNFEPQKRGDELTDNDILLESWMKEGEDKALPGVASYEADKEEKKVWMSPPRKRKVRDSYSSLSRRSSSEEDDGARSAGTSSSNRSEPREIRRSWDKQGRQQDEGETMPGTVDMWDDSLVVFNQPGEDSVAQEEIKSDQQELDEHPEVPIPKSRHRSKTSRRLENAVSFALRDRLFLQLVAMAVFALVRPGKGRRPGRSKYLQAASPRILREVFAP